MTITKPIDMGNKNNVNFFKIDKTTEEKAKEKARYNNFMNFITDIVVRYGIDENRQ